MHITEETAGAFLFGPGRYLRIFDVTTEVTCFLVGASSLKEKSPTITVGSFFSAYNLTLIGPLFLQSLFICSTNFLIFFEAGDRGFDSRTKPQIFYASKSRCETKGFLSFDFFRFFRQYGTFFRKFSDSIKG